MDARFLSGAPRRTNQINQVRGSTPPTAPFQPIQPKTQKGQPGSTSSTNRSSNCDGRGNGAGAQSRGGRVFLASVGRTSPASVAVVFAITCCRTATIVASWRAPCAVVPTVVALWPAPCAVVPTIVALRPAPCAVVPTAASRCTFGPSHAGPTWVSPPCCGPKENQHAASVRNSHFTAP